jgi:hypothetical protein
MKHVKNLAFFLIVFVVLAFNVLNARAQVPTWEWASCAIGNGEGLNIARDLDGNVYLTGFYSDTISFGSHVLIDSNANGKLFIAKYDSLGNVIWARTAGGTGGVVGNCITTDLTGNIYVAGYFAAGSVSFDSFTINSAGGYDVCLVKYDSSGNALWARSAGGSSGDFCYGVSVDNQGNAYITGTYNGAPMTIGSYTLTNTGNADIFIAKYDSSGNVVWAKNSVGSVADWVYNSTTDAVGNTYLVGYFNSPTLSFDTITLTLNSNTNGFIAKYDSSGNAMWAKNPTGYSTGRAVAVDSSGNYYFAGTYGLSSVQFDNDTLFNTGQANIFLVKYDSLGNVKWAKTSIDTSSCVVYNLAVDREGTPAIIGRIVTSPITFDTITLQLPTGSADPSFIVKFDSSGNAVFGFALSSGADDQNAIAITTTNSIYVGGDFEVNPFIVGGDTLTHTSGETPFVAKLGYKFTEDVEEANVKSETLVYPNPSSTGLFNISVNHAYGLAGTEAAILKTEVYNYIGEKVLERGFGASGTSRTSVAASATEAEIDLRAAACGIYFVQVTTREGVFTGKVIVEK